MVRNTARGVSAAALAVALGLVGAAGTAKADTTTVQNPFFGTVSPAGHTDAGTFEIRVRGVGVFPQTGGSTTVGGHVQASDTGIPEADFTYFFTPNIAAELIAGVTPHRITAKGTAVCDVDVGTVWLLPPTLTAQYHFNPDGKIDPYLGAGINYTFFFDHHVPGSPVNSVKYDNNVGGAIQAGFDYRIDDHWVVNFDVKQLFLTTTAHLGTVLGPVEAKNVDINPTLVGFGLGYRF